MASEHYNKGFEPEDIETVSPDDVDVPGGETATVSYCSAYKPADRSWAVVKTKKL